MSNDSANCVADPKRHATANYFAMLLLVPDFLLEEEIKKRGGVGIDDDEKLKQLAAKFEVPIMVMATRLGIYFKENKL